MFAIGNEELEQKEPLGDFILCDKCGERHIVEYGNKVEADGSLTQSKMLSFYKCNDKLYLAGINGKRV